MYLVLSLLSPLFRIAYIFCIRFSIMELNVVLDGSFNLKKVLLDLI